VTQAKERQYDSSLRKQRAGETRQRILQAARSLFASHGFGETTIGAIAKKARVAAPTIYAAFGSKDGILAGLLDAAAFGPDYEALVAEGQEVEEAEARLRFAARIARRVHESTQNEVDFIVSSGASIPVLELERRREKQRYERQSQIVEKLKSARKLKPGLTVKRAREILWALTCRELFRLLVREQNWPAEQYESWLSETLVAQLVSLS
jgi:AcrR family transcriptional regulator